MNIPSTRKLIRPLVVALALAGVPAMTVASAATSTAATCASTTAGWGSGPRNLDQLGISSMTNVRAGSQTCFDRMVVDIRGTDSGYSVQYVSQVRNQGEGAVIPLRGGARLEIITARADDVDTGLPAFQPGNRREVVDVSGFPTFRQVAWGGSFEGYTTIGLGVRGRLPMRAFILDGPGPGSRLVVDVAHTW